MKPAPTPENEKERLISLHTLGLLDTEPEERFDRITRTATKIFNVPISTLTLVDEKREWFKSVCGLDEKEGDRAISFCGHALLANEVFVIPDTTKDVRFSDNPMVVGKPYIRFYAGVPIISADGERVGVFCIKDTKPRFFSKDDEEVLKGLASWAEVEVNSRNLNSVLQEGRKVRAKMKDQMQELENARRAAQNVFEDLSIEKSKVEIAKAKEEAILMSIGDGLIATDEKGNITLINKTAEKLFDKKSKEVIGKSFFEVIVIEDEKGVPIPLEKRPIKIALGGDTTTTATTTTGPTYYYVRKDKTKFPAAIMVAPIILGGKIIGAIGVFRDITKEKDIDKAKTEFVSLASHQLKSPLTAINWYTELLMSGDAGKTNRQQEKYLKEVSQSSHRMVELVNALLNVSRLEMGTFIIEPTLVDLISVCRSVIKEVNPIVRRKKIRLNLKYGKRLSKFMADEKLLRMIIQNLLSNAIKYSANGGGITVDAHQEKRGCLCGPKTLVEDSFVIKISDNGCGIPKQQQHQIFTKLFRADNVQEMDTDGTGLGLYIIKSILDESGGSIWFESKENVGTTFYVAIPTSGMKQKTGTKALS